MKKLIYLLLFNQISIAQTPLKGYVTELNSSKKPVDNVLVKSLGANSITSTQSGNFTLQFQGLEPGFNVVIQAEKTGWELVNEKEMQTTLPADPNHKPLKIIVCKAGTLEIARKI